MLCRFHITFGKKRTTIMVDTILSEMMAIKLGELPGTAEAHRAVRLWLQDTLVSALGNYEGRNDASQWARRYLIEAIADSKISKKWGDWKYELD
jgi:hypothetical protein